MRLLVLAGGGLSVFFEAFGDKMGMIWHAAIGQWTLIHQFGHYVPVWMVAAYYWFCGGQTLYVISRIRNGATSSDLWRLYGLFLLADAVLEIPVLWLTDIYTYFGHQPFWYPPYFPLPAWYLVLNALLPLAAARAVLYLCEFKSSAYLWLIPIIMPMSLYAIYSATAWPVWAALNSDVSDTAIYFAGSVTIVFGLIAAHLLCSNPRGKFVKTLSR
jgi:hypothetical protein